jgi:hypothetical protein
MQFARFLRPIVVVACGCPWAERDRYSRLSGREHAVPA